MNLLITKEVDDSIAESNSSKEKLSVDSLIERINNTNDIIDVMSRNSCMMKIVALFLKGYTASMNSLINENVENYKYQILRLYEDLSKAHNVQTVSLYKKYDKYLPSDGEFKFLNRIMTDKLTTFDVKSTLSVLYSGLFDTIHSIKDAADNTISEAKKNQNTEMIASKAIEFSDGKYCQTKEYAGYSNSEKFYYKIIEKAVANNTVYNQLISGAFGTHDFNKNTELPGLNYIMMDFCDILQMAISGPIYRFVWSPIYQLVKYLSFFLSMQMKTLFGENIFIDYLAKNKISVETVNLTENDVISLVSLIVFYAYSVEMHEQDKEFYGKKDDCSEQMMVNLNIIKDLSLDLIQKSLNLKPSDVRKLVNHIYEVFCNDPVLGKTVPEKFRLGNDPFIRFASFLRDDMSCCMSEESIDKVIERVKEIRNKDVYGEYHDDVATFLRNTYSYDAITEIAKWITRLEKWQDYQNPSMTVDWQRYKNIDNVTELWRKLWDDKSHRITLLGDSSDFGACMAIAPNSIFKNSNLGVSILNDAKAYLLTVLLNAHMSDERSLNWKPDTINLLNFYISYISSAITYDMYRWNKTNTDQIFTKMFDVFNVCGKLKYRTYRIPQFRFKKDEIPPVEHLKPYELGESWISKIIASATETTVNKTPETVVDAVVRYLGDGILNNAVNAEYVIMALVKLREMYHEIEFSPFTKIIRYILARVGSQDDDFYKSFKTPEKPYNCLEIFKKSVDYNEDEEKTFNSRVARLEKYLEIYVFIGILQHILINIEFNKQVENRFKDSTVDFGNIETRTGRNYDVSKIGNHYRECGANMVVAIEENPIIKDITNAMQIFDSTFVGANTKNSDWFEMNKDKIIVSNGKNIEQLKKSNQDGDQGPVTTIGEV